MLELGSRTVNGSVREIFTAAERYHGIDVADGPGVDQVGDAGSVVMLPNSWDAVVCCEVFEHTASGAAICANAFAHLRRGGVFIVTCAGPGRPPHACDGGALAPGEFYSGVSQAQLRHWLTVAGFGFALVDGHSVAGDTYALAVKL